MTQKTQASRSKRLRQACLYAIIDTAYVPQAHWEKTTQALMEGGAELLQIRAKKESTKERAKLIERSLPLTQAFGVPLILNDDIQLAARYKIGAHIGQEDTPVPIAREQLGQNAILGLSTHSLAQAKAACTQKHLLDYFALGPIFPTATKPDYKAIGLNPVAQLAALEPPLPWVCIGGITQKNAAEVFQSGALGLVAVSAVLNSADPAASLQSLRKLRSKQSQGL